MIENLEAMFALIINYGHFVLKKNPKENINIRYKVFYPGFIPKGRGVGEEDVNKTTKETKKLPDRLGVQNKSSSC